MLKMHDMFIVAKFTAKDMAKRKSFVISTIIILAMIVIGFNIPKIIKSFNNGTDKIVIVDKENIFENKIKPVDNNTEIILENYSVEEIKEKIKNDDIEYGIIINKTDKNVINLTYVLENKMSSGPSEEFEASLTTLYKDIQIEKLDIDAEKKARLTPEFDYNLEVADENIKGNPLVMMMISIVLFYAVYFSAFQVSNSITTEKTSKIMETLVTSTSPRTIVLGKTIGIGLIGLFQVILFITTAIICANVFLDSEMINALLDVSKITPGFIIITLVYFILGYFAYALLYALTGSLVTKPEDIQSANTPVSMIAMIGFYLGYFSISIDPTSSIAGFAGIFPISSAFCMPSRIMMGLASPQDIAISIVLLIAMVALIAKVAISVYSNAILNYGSKMSLKEALKQYRERK